MARARTSVVLGADGSGRAARAAHAVARLGVGRGEPSQNESRGQGHNTSLSMAPGSRVLIRDLPARVDPAMDLRALPLLAALLGRCAAPSPAPVAVGATPAEVRYLALGDSFTIGTGSSPAQAFPARLAARWSSARCRVELRNPAVNGYTTQDVLDRELPEVRPFAPTRVTLAVGANDLVRGSDGRRYRAQLQHIFDALGAAGVPASRVVTLPQPDWAHTPAGASFGDPSEIHARIVEFNAVMGCVSHRAHAALLMSC